MMREFVLVLLVAVFASACTVPVTRNSDGTEAPTVAGLADNARELRSQGDPEAALAQLDGLLVREEDNVELRILRAQILLDTGDPVEARQCLEQVLEVAPDHVEGLLLVGYCLLDVEEADAARGKFERVLNLAPDPITAMSAHLGLATIFEQDGEQRRANAHYAGAIALEPELREVLLQAQTGILSPAPISAGTHGNGLSASDPHRRRLIQGRVDELLAKKKDKSKEGDK